METGCRKDRLATETDQAYLNANPDGTATRFNDSLRSHPACA